MTVEASVPYESYLGDGIATDFPFEHSIDDASDLQVWRVVGGVATLQTLNVNYEVTIGEDEDDVTVTYVVATIPTPLPSGNRLVIFRNRELSQLIDIINSGGVYLASFQSAVDQLTRAQQNIAVLVSRSLSLHISDVDGSGAFDARSNRIKNIGNPIDDNDAVTKGSLDSLTQDAVNDAEAAAAAAAASASAANTDAGTAAAAAASATASAASASDSADDAADTLADVIASGKILRSGTVDPGPGDGNNGDFWINYSTWTVFGPKSGGVWPAGVGMVGEVSGPAVSVSGNFASFNGTSGDVIQDSGKNAADFVAAIEKGAAGGVATLDGGGKLTSSQLPTLAITSVSQVASQAAQLALTAQEGDVAIRTDQNNRVYMHNGGTAGTMADWTVLESVSYLPIAGGTMFGLLTTLASASGGAGFRVPHGAAPSAPVNGDLWSTSAGGMFARINGVTYTIGLQVMDQQTFNANGTWNKPTFGTWVIIEAWGGGASGGVRTTTGSAGGGGGGGYSKREMPFSAVAASYAITIGQGGASVASSNANGNPGGNTTVGSILTAYGGGSGAHAAASTVTDGGGGGGPAGAGENGTNTSTDGKGGAGGGGYGGASGTATISKHALSPYGGGGGGAVDASNNNLNPGDAFMGGAGGGATSSSGNTAGGTSQLGGNGGAGNSGGAGVAGTAPGGGGGGARNGGASGAGANGRVIITVLG